MQDQGLKDFLQLPQNRRVLEAQQRKELKQNLRLQEKGSRPPPFNSRQAWPASAVTQSGSVTVA